MTDKFINIKKAAEMLSVSPLTLRNWDKSGKFKAIRHPINNYRVYKLQDIEDLIGEIGSGEKKIPKTKKLDIKHLE